MFENLIANVCNPLKGDQYTETAETDEDNKLGMTLGIVVPCRASVDARNVHAQFLCSTRRTGFCVVLDERLDKLRRRLATAE